MAVGGATVTLPVTWRRRVSSAAAVEAELLRETSRNETLSRHSEPSGYTSLYSHGKNCVRSAQCRNLR